MNQNERDKISKENVWTLQSITLKEQKVFGKSKKVILRIKVHAPFTCRKWKSCGRRYPRTEKYFKMGGFVVCSCVFLKKYLQL